MVSRNAAARPIHDPWPLFVGEGVLLIALGILAASIPSIGSRTATALLGWVFLASGVAGLATTFWARRLPAFFWSLVSALLAIVVGVVLIGNQTSDLYGGLMGWPFQPLGQLRTVLLVFLLVEGGVSIMFALDHRRQLSGRWSWMLVSGVLDIALASIILLDLPASSAWTMGLLIGINLAAGGVALL